CAGSPCRTDLSCPPEAGDVILWVRAISGRILFPTLRHDSRSGALRQSLRAPSSIIHDVF
ncbi:hypothetical protein, partial [Paracoccus sp. (in: a-proteobacteria)]|uniref:hypothetical protein n=1 Tax=Paracoccus sp. TaxID=267 RepID=UPI0035B1AE99